MGVIIQFGADGHDESGPYAYGMYAAIVYVQIMFIPRTPIMMCGCIYIIRADGRDESDPTPTVCALQLFMYNQCLFHEHVIFTHVHQTFYPRTPTVGADLSCPYITEHTLRITVCNQCLILEYPL